MFDIPLDPIAAYGAALSTAILIRQLWKERPDIAVNYYIDQRGDIDDPEDYAITEVINRGGKAVKIDRFQVVCSNGQRKPIIPDTAIPGLPAKISEGEKLTILLEGNHVLNIQNKYGDIEYVEVIDQTGKIYNSKPNVVNRIWKFISRHLNRVKNVQL